MSLLLKSMACFAVLTTTVAIVGCGESALPPTATPTPLDPEAVLAKSGQVMGDLRTFHFKLEHPVGSTALIPGLAVDEAEGDIVKPDRLEAKFSARFGNIAVLSRMKAIGDVNYLTNPLTGDWETVDTNVSPIGFFNPSKGITGMLAQLEQVALLKAPRSAGDVYVLKGMLPVDALGPLLGSTLEDTLVETELTIRADSFHLLKAVFDGRVIPTDADEVVRVVTLSRFNEDIVIEPPE